MLKVVILSVVLFALAFAAIAIKLLVKKDGKFAGTCAGNSPFLKRDGENCSVCGARPEEQCKAPSKKS